MKTPLIYETISDLIHPQWDTGRGTKKKHFRLEHVGFGKILSEAYQTEIKAQFWMNAVRKPNKLHFELEGDFEERRALSDALKNHIGHEKPIWVDIPDEETKLASVDVSRSIENVREYLTFIEQKIASFNLQWVSSDNDDQVEKVRNTIERMIDNAFYSIQQSGSQSTVVQKEKDTDMDRIEMEEYVAELLNARERKCALSNIPFLLDDEAGPSRLRASLDRIDSSLGYIRGNLQIVCRFINIWKSDMNNDEFVDLLNLIHKTKPNQSR